MVEKEEELTCPICICVKQKKSTILSPCRHSFCNDCLYGLKTNQCPVCRQSIEKEDFDTDYCCKFDKVQVICKDENGLEICMPLSDLATQSTQRHDFGNDFKSKFVPRKDIMPKRNTQTFACPCCRVRNLDREGLIDHVESSH